jgi:dihydroorotase
VDGTVDAIASDHAPHHADEKDQQFSTAPFGIVGLETTLSLCLDRLVQPGIIDLPRLVELLSTGPARAFGLPGGSLAPGGPADLTLIDLGREVTICAEDFRSLGRNTPFGGWELTGAAVGTFLDGRPVELPPRG